LVYAGTVTWLIALTLLALLGAVARGRRRRMLLRAGIVAGLVASPRPALLAVLTVIASVALVSLYILPVTADVAVIGVAITNIVP
jgi:hypothetical protein